MHKSCRNKHSTCMITPCKKVAYFSKYVINKEVFVIGFHTRTPLLSVNLKIWWQLKWKFVSCGRCGHSKQLEPEYEKLGTSFKKAKSILIGKVSYVLGSLATHPLLLDTFLSILWLSLFFIFYHKLRWVINVIDIIILQIEYKLSTRDVFGFSHFGPMVGIYKLMALGTGGLWWAKPMWKI